MSASTLFDCAMFTRLIKPLQLSTSRSVEAFTARLDRALLDLFFASIFSLIVSGPGSFAAESASFSPDKHIDRRTSEASGDRTRPVRLKVEIVKPFGPGPFPLVVFNHGANWAEASLKSTNDVGADFNMGVYYFLSRGYAVALPHLRGYGGSGGTLPDTGCALEALGRANAKDILAALSEVVTDPKIDATRIIATGESLGGWNALAMAGEGDPRVKAVINFYGGIRSSACKASDKALIEGAKSLGKGHRVPSLWLYGDNDRFFSRPLWEAMYRAYAAGGSETELFGYGKYGTDAHTLLGQPYSIRVFEAKLEAFLKRQGFPTRITHQEFVPISPPPASGYAAIDDVNAVPFLNDQQRQAYREFLKKPAPKVFLIAEWRSVFVSAGGYDPMAIALANCEKEGLVCRPYAFNSDVVWSYPNAQPAATRFAAIGDAAAVPYIDDAGREGYRKFLEARSPKAFVITPTGHWAATSGSLDPTGTTLANCRKQNADCRPYAVDRHVVWPENPARAPR
jgi:dienelactone hydrolase